jgi:hypothetical protein
MLGLPANYGSRLRCRRGPVTTRHSVNCVQFLGLRLKEREATSRHSIVGCDRWLVISIIAPQWMEDATRNVGDDPAHGETVCRGA